MPRWATPAKDGERLHRISPLFHATNIKKPLLVVQGANDPRVLKVESDEIVEAVKKNQVPVEYLVFPDEGHGFEKEAKPDRGVRGLPRVPAGAPQVGQRRALRAPWRSAQGGSQSAPRFTHLGPLIAQRARNAPFCPRGGVVGLRLRFESRGRTASSGGDAAAVAG
jgi:acetyl esterase/lipase